MSTTARYDVVVFGAGLIGATFALLLARRSELKIAVVERAAAGSFNSLPNQRVVALGALATSLLGEIGAMDKFTIEQAYPYTKMFVWDENSDGQLCFRAAEYGQNELGHLVDSSACTRLLHEQMGNQSNVESYYDFAADRIVDDDTGVSVFSKSREITARLLIAADGADSWARKQARIFSHRQPFKQFGIVAKIRTSLSHQDTAWQRFLATGPVAVLPLHDNQSSIVWSTDCDYGESLMQLSEDEFCLVLANALDNRLGEIDLLSPRQVFPLQSQRADMYYRGRVVLVGDAAHSIHPLAGQGANLGFKDADCLADLLQRQPAQRLYAVNMLRRYQRSRKTDNEQTDWLMRVLHRAYRSDNPWWQIARGRGMNFLAGSRRVKTLLAKHAMGI